MTSPAPPGQPDARTPRSRAAHLSMAFYAVLIGSSFPVGEAIAGNLDPAVLTLFRFVLAAAILGCVLALRRELVLPTSSLMARTATIGALMAVFFVAMFEALRWTSALSTGALFTLVPLLSSVFGYMLIGQRVRAAHLACLVLGAAGAVWIVFEGDPRRLMAFSLGYGELIFMAGVLAFSLYAPAIRRLHRGELPLAFAFWNLVMGGLLLLVYAFPALLETDFAAVETETWAGVVYLAVFPTAVTFFLSTLASLALPAFVVMSYDLSHARRRRGLRRPVPGRIARPPASSPASPWSCP